MINPTTNKHFGVISADGDKTIKTVRYTFEFASCEVKWGRSVMWKRTKKRFDSMDDAVRAAGLWMQICFDNDCPVAVRLVEE